MNSPAIGMAYVLWLKARWVLGGMLIYIGGMAIAIQLQVLADAQDQVICSSLLLTFGMAILLNVFIFSPTDLGAKGSAYPAHMLVLPLRTRALIGWPMLYGLVSQVVLWELLAGLVLIPGGFHAPLVWPAVILAAVTVWVQALAWSPFPSPYARVPALVLAMCPIMGLWIWVGFYPHNALVFAGAIIGTLGWMFVAYGVGAFGLAQTRTGNAWDWGRYFADFCARLARVRPTRTVKARPPLHSANAAQLWYERRRNVIFLPGMLAMLIIPMSLLLGTAMVDLSHNPGLTIAAMHFTLPMLGLGVLLFVSIFMSTMASQNLAKFDMWGKETISPFFAARPMSNVQLVGNKFKAAAISALMGWGMVMFILGEWAILDASSFNRNDSLVRGFFAQATVKDVFGVALLPVLLLFVMWRNLVAGMWPVLTGRKWVSTTIGLLPAGMVFSAPGLYGWLLRQPDLKEKLATWLPWILAAVVSLKLISAVGLGTALWQRKLITSAAICRAAIAWTASVLILFGAVGYFIEWSWYLVAGAALLVPLTSLAAAPLALDWNRHR